MRKIISVTKKNEASINKIEASSNVSEQLESLQKQVAYLTQLVLALTSQNKSVNSPSKNQNPQNNKFLNSRRFNHSYNSNYKNDRSNNRNENKWQEVRYKPRGQQNATGRRCFTCGFFQHVSRFCPTNRRINYLE